MTKKGLKSILTGHTGTFSRNTIVSMLFLLFCLVSCSNSVFDSKVLPEKIKYKKVKFQPCPTSNIGYVCISNSEAIDLVLNLKKCQEQNNLLRELNGN